jgi:hypothetical protein
MDEQPAAQPATMVTDPTLADSGTLAEEGVVEPVGGGQHEPPVPPWLVTE